LLPLPARASPAETGRQRPFADQDSSRSDRSNLMVRQEGQRYLESRQSERDAVGAWMTAMS